MHADQSSVMHFICRSRGAPSACSPYRPKFLLSDMQFSSCMLCTHAKIGTNGLGCPKGETLDPPLHFLKCALYHNQSSISPQHSSDAPVLSHNIFQIVLVSCVVRYSVNMTIQPMGILYFK